MGGRESLQELDVAWRASEEGKEEGRSARKISCVRSASCKHSPHASFICCSLIYWEHEDPDVILKYVTSTSSVTQALQSDTKKKYY